MNISMTNHRYKKLVNLQQCVIVFVATVNKVSALRNY